MINMILSLLAQCHGVVLPTKICDANVNELVTNSQQDKIFCCKVGVSTGVVETHWLGRQFINGL